MVQPDNFDEAWELLQKSPRNVILGGGLFLKLGEKSINKAVDLTHLGLDFIEKVDDSIRIGSMVSFDGWKSINCSTMKQEGLYANRWRL